MPVRRTREAELFTALILESFRFRGSLERHGSKLAGRYGQSTARWQVMGAASDGDRTVPQIARRMGLSRQGVQRVANLLAADGLAEFVDNPDHSRSQLLQLTREGRRVYEQINAAQAMWANATVKGVPVRDLRAAVATLRRLIERLSEQR